MAAAAAFVLLVGTVVLTRSVQADSEQAASKSNQHVLTVYDGGVERGVLTEAETLSQALKDAGFEINQNDITEPRLDEKLVAPTYDVNIYRARPVLGRGFCTTYGAAPTSAHRGTGDVAAHADSCSAAVRAGGAAALPGPAIPGDAAGAFAVGGGT